MKLHISRTGTMTQHSYRTAFVRKVFLETSHDDAARELEVRLAGIANANIDNHTVYEIVVSSGEPPIYVMFSDLTVRWGLSIDEERW